jgi:TM2 domain-containing membrane protein YozV
MKRLCIISILFFSTTFVKANAPIYRAATDNTTVNYEINDAQIEQLFSEANDITDTQLLNVLNKNMNSPTFKDSKSALTATLLSFFLGSLGIHRFYLGTKTLTGIGYILTCGGLGIVSFIDFVVLLIRTVENKSIAPFVDNPKFFMWSGGNM